MRWTRRGSAAALVLLAVLLAVVGPAAPSWAHAELVGTDPQQGAVLDRLPGIITLTFSEPVGQVPGGVTVYDATGAELAASVSTRDRDLLVAIADPVESGTVVVAWRVVSDDGHPVAGSLTFSVGEPSARTATRAATSAPRSVSVALSLSRWPAYAGLLVAVGLVWFVALVLPPRVDHAAGVRRRLAATARRAAAVSVVAWLVGLALDALYLRGAGFGSLLDAATLDAVPDREVVATAVTAVALVTAVLLRGPAASVAALVALVPQAYVGHSVAMDHAQLNVVVDGFHLVAAAAWLGGLVGVAVVLAGTSTRTDLGPVVVARFSALAASVLAALVLAGSVLAWQLVGSWDGLVDSGYGRVLLLKVALVAAAAGVAAYNRVRLVPDATAHRRTLGRTVTAEAGVLLAVVLVTGFLVQQSPPSGVGSGGTSASSGGPVSGTTDLGGLRARVTVEPAVVGSNTVTVQVVNSAGTPAELFNPPTLRVLGAAADLGDVALTPTALGTYRGSVLVPVAGTWRFQVSVRVDELTNPVGTVELRVR